MQGRSDIVIISAFGRGHGLAQQLAKKGKVVSLVDVSDQLGRWTPEDWAGPFGSFPSDEKTPDDVISSEVPRGFTFWMNHGPLELRGPLADYALKQNGVSEATIKYLKGQGPKPQESYESSWLAHFAHQFSTNIFRDNFEALNSGKPLPLFAPFYSRSTTRDQIISSFKNCVAQGVRVFTSAKIMDISIVAKEMDAVEVSGERSGVLTGTQFIWLLSGEESQAFPERVHTTLYPKGAVESSWCWIRYRFWFSEGFEREALPGHFVLLKDIGLPWTHSHLCVAQKSGQPGEYHFWVRVPSKRRFQRGFLDEVSEEILGELKRRMPSISISMVERPMEYQISHKEIGAPKYQVFSEENLRKLKRLALKNLHFCGPEDWPSLDWNGQAAATKRFYLKFVEELQRLESSESTIPQSREDSHDSTL